MTAALTAAAYLLVAIACAAGSLAAWRGMWRAIDREHVSKADELDCWPRGPL